MSSDNSTRGSSGVSSKERRALTSLLLLLPSLAAAATLPLTVVEDAGVARQMETVTSGVPFPQGALKTNSPVQLLDSLGNKVHLQSQPTATWRDGSVKWLLLD